MILRKKIEERNALLTSSMDNDPKYSKAVDALKSIATKINMPVKPEKRASEDSALQFTSCIPLEKRKSARLEKKDPTFSHSDLPNEVNRKRIADNGEEEEDCNHLENVVIKPKSHRISNRPPREERNIIQVEDVTPAMLNNIARKASEKRRSDEKGTTCHQCRQTTTDTKTCCRSSQCIGVRGQYCGPCMTNRYREDVAVALLDPNWECFVCQGTCNCSFCRPKEGKRPAGISTHVAQEDQDDSEKLLGFSSDLKYAILNNYVKYDLYREYKCKKDTDVSLIKDSNEIGDDIPPKNVEKIKKSDAQLKISPSNFGLTQKKTDYSKPKGKNENKGCSSEDDLKENNNINKSELLYIREPDSHVLIEKNSTGDVTESTQALSFAKEGDSDEQLLMGFTKEGTPVLK